jgi:hypothetical protein
MLCRWRVPIYLRRGASTVKRVTHKAITAAAPHRPDGYVDHVLSVASRQENGWVYFEDDVFADLLKQYSPERLYRGPGKVLHDMLARFGIHMKPNCQCKARMAQMDKWGCDECEKNIETIVEWMREEAATRKLPYLKTIGRLLVRRAISTARREAKCAKTQT